MNAAAIIDRMERFDQSLSALLAGMPADDARFKPADGAWSILEVVRHLADEETADFRMRLQCTLADPSADWPPIDPERWAVERRYNEGELTAAVESFVAERQASIAWLRGLTDVDWDVACEHPRFGTFRAGDLLAAWSAHDALHLRQIAKRLFQLTERDAARYSTRYAGEWRA